MAANISVDYRYYKLINSSRLSELERTLLESQWDAETDHDVNRIQKEVNIINRFKRVAIVKLLCLPIESLVATFLYTKEENDHRKANNKLYFKVLFKKVSYNTLKKQLIVLSKDDIILI